MIGHAALICRFVNDDDEWDFLLIILFDQMQTIELPHLSGTPRGIFDVSRSWRETVSRRVLVA